MKWLDKLLPQGGAKRLATAAAGIVLSFLVAVGLPISEELKVHLLEALKWIFVGLLGALGLGAVGKEKAHIEAKNGAAK